MQVSRPLSSYLLGMLSMDTTVTYLRILDWDLEIQSTLALSFRTNFCDHDILPVLIV